MAEDLDRAPDQKVFRASPIRLVLMIAASLSFIGLGLLWIDSTSGPVELGLVSFLIALICLLALRGLYVLLAGREELKLDRNGFTISAWSGPVGWHDVEEVYIICQSGRWSQFKPRYLCFQLNNAWHAADNRSWPYRLLSWINERIGYGHLTLSTLMYDEPYRQLVETTFDAYCAAVPEVERDENWCGLPYTDEPNHD